MFSLLLGGTILDINLALISVGHHNDILLLSVWMSYLSRCHILDCLSISLVEVSGHRLLKSLGYLLRSVDEGINLLCAWLGEDSLIRLDGDVGVISRLVDLKISPRVLTIRDRTIADDIDGNSLDSVLAVPSALVVKLLVIVTFSSTQARL